MLGSLLSEATSSVETELRLLTPVFEKSCCNVFLTTLEATPSLEPFDCSKDLRGQAATRPLSPAVFDRETVRELARKGMSVRQIAKKLGLGYGTVRRALKGLKSPAKK